MDSLDLRILSEMQLDGRQTVTDLARRLGISRTLATNRLGRLLDRKIARIVAYTNPFALGYRTLAVTGVRVSPGEMDAVDDKLRALPNVIVLIVAAGWQDIIIWTMFANPADLSGFLAEQLGSISGITSTETMMVIEWRASLPLVSSGQRRKVFFSYPPLLPLATGHNRQQQEAALTQQKGPGPDLIVDQLDLMLLRELEQDGRQPISDLARKLHISRANASTRLQRLLSKQITKIMASTAPVHLGYDIFAMIGMRVSPNKINATLDKAEAMPNVYWVARVAGRHDVIVGTVFPNLTDLSRSLRTELGTLSGVLSMDTMIGLEVKKMAFSYVASSYLQSIERSQQ
jgi:DNA-binding Lrp family transcriptional regulator